MKKLFISITAAFIFMLSCIIPFTAYAEEDAHYYTWAQYRNYWSYDSSNYEFLFKYEVNANDSYYYDTCGISLTQAQFNQYVQSCTMSNGIFEVIFSTPQTFYISEKAEYWPQDVPNNYSWQYNISKFQFDTANNILFLYDINGNGILQDYAHHTNMSFNITDYTCNFEQFITEPITVEVFPDLGENFNYSGTYDGYTAELNTLQVDITNNTGYNYEYAILVQPKNAELNVGLPNNSQNNTFFWGSSPITYALVKDEWIQRDAVDAISDIMNSIGYNPNVSGYEAAPITINTPSAWHYLPHNDTKREWIYYEQMQLKKGVDYTFKVYVYNITQNAPQTFSDQLVYPAFQNIELVYSKDFSVTKDTKYDADSVSNGAYSFDNTATLGSQFDKIKAYEEPNGNIRIFDNNTSSASGRVGSNSSYNNLISNSSSFLSLLKNVFNYLPDYVSMLLFGGLFCIVLVAIWRKL